MKKWMITAVILMVLGGAVFMASFVAADFNFFAIGTDALTEKTYEINEPIQNIEIVDNTGDVRLVLGDAGRVECQESQLFRYAVSVEKGTLRIRVADQRKWYHYLGFSFSARTVTVYLPADSYQSLSVETNTGNVSVSEGFTFGRVELSSDTGNLSCGASVEGILNCETDTGNILVKSPSLGKGEFSSDTGNISLSELTAEGSLSFETDTGNLNLTHVTCEKLSLETDTGDANLTKVICRADLFAETDTGDISFDACDAASVTVGTDAGDVEGTFCTDKIFQVSTKSGSVSVPSSFVGTPCKVSTRSGDVDLRILPKK